MPGKQLFVEPTMLWVKSLHVIFMVTWFSGLFYLPRIFVYHAMTEDQATRDTFKVMERKLLIMTHIGGLLTLLFGLILLTVWFGAYLSEGWMQLKLLLVVALMIYHGFCVKFVSEFKHDKIRHSHKWFRLFNEIPVLFLFGSVVLVFVRP